MVSVCSALAPIVVGVDGSQTALDAVRWAACEARHRSTGLRLVDAVGTTPAPRPGDSRVGLVHREALLDGAAGALGEAAAVAQRTVPGSDVVTEVLTGEAVPSLVAESEHAPLLVLGNRGLGGVAALLTGSVAVALAAHARCPVVVVRGSAGGGPVPMEGPVVVGMDGSIEGAEALAFAYEAASARRVPLVAVHAWQDTIADRVSPPPGGEAAFQEENLAGWLASWEAKFPDVAVHRVVARDRPAPTLLERSAAAQLVVVGSRGRGAFAGLVLGSVSQALLHHATCPVAVVRPAGAAPC
jgi:nucleotide-binding universal stress UspA family protein